eukprot:589202-Amphidinium_carterae.1
MGAVLWTCRGGDENADRQAVDLGILFHAKEFPMEWRPPLAHRDQQWRNKEIPQKSVNVSEIAQTVLLAS